MICPARMVGAVGATVLLPRQVISIQSKDLQLVAADFRETLGGYPPTGYPTPSIPPRNARPQAISIVPVKNRVAAATKRPQRPQRCTGWGRAVAGAT